MKQVFPVEAFSNHIAILGKTGSGKTTAAKGFVESLLDAGKRVCALDPTGVWWGLRLLADGKGEGHPIIIFGGSHADIPIDEHAGARLAEIIATGTFSCVIDTSIMTVGARTRFFTEFAESLFRANAKPLHLIIDEAHLFAPQGRVPDPQSGRMVHAANNLVSGGRARGLRIMLISQRPAKLHKDSLTQVETLIAMRLIAPQDRAAVEAWIGEWTDQKHGREVIASLPSLPRGQGWVWAPELGILSQIQFPRIKTFDSSQTPEDGYIQAPVGLSAIDIDSIRNALATPDHDKPAPTGRKATISRAELEIAEKRGYEKGFTAGMEQGRVAAFTAAGTEITAAIERLKGKTVATITPASVTPRRVTPAEGTTKGGAEIQVLRVLAARHPARFTKAQWATLAGMKRTGGTWLTYISRLRTAGYIDERDNTVGVTPEGMAAAGSVESPSPGSVIEQWKSALGSGPAKMIDALIAVHPRGMERESLAGHVGMVATGGSFSTYLSRLKTNGLIEITGREIAASQTLFLDSRGQAA